MIRGIPKEGWKPMKSIVPAADNQKGDDQRNP
jgi:hypothetical protein